MARALVKEPKVLLADEPTGNLDEDTRDDIIALLETMWRERGLTMVLVTHDSSIARQAQRIGVMKNGRLTLRKGRTGRAAQAEPGAGRRPGGPPQAAGQASTEPADLPDDEFEDMADSDSEPADTVTFD